MSAKDELPEGYMRCIEAMDRAAMAWIKAHPFASPGFRFQAFESEVKRQAGRPDHERVAVGVALCDVVDRVADNEDGRQLVRAMVDAAEAHGGATYMMLRFIVDSRIEAWMDAHAGTLDAQGDWACPCCGAVLLGYQAVTEGKGERPGPGALNVCSACSGLSRVRASGDGFELIPEADFVALPPDLRANIRDLQNAMRKARANQRAREASRS